MISYKHSFLLLQILIWKSLSISQWCWWTSFTVHAPCTVRQRSAMKCSSFVPLWTLKSNWCSHHSSTMIKKFIILQYILSVYFFNIQFHSWWIRANLSLCGQYFLELIWNQWIGPLLNDLQSLLGCLLNRRIITRNRLQSYSSRFLYFQEPYVFRI